MENLRSRFSYDDMLPTKIDRLDATPTRTSNSPYAGAFHIYLREATSDYCAITYSADDNYICEGNFKLIDNL